MNKNLGKKWSVALQDHQVYRLGGFLAVLAIVVHQFMLSQLWTSNFGLKLAKKFEYTYANDPGKDDAVIVEILY